MNNQSTVQSSPSQVIPSTVESWRAPAETGEILSSSSNNFFTSAGNHQIHEKDISRFKLFALTDTRMIV